MAHSADVLVIGAGIMGAASAYRLAERGLKVQILEAQDSPALGSSGKSAAGVRRQFNTPTNIELSLHSIAEYREMPEAEFKNIGYLILVPPELWRTHAAGVERQHRLGVGTQILTPGAAQKVLAFDAAGLHACTYGLQDGVVDPHGITFGFLRRARELGAGLHTGTRVDGLWQEGGAWHAHTSGGDYSAPTIVNASGAWSGELAELAGFRLPVWPGRRMVYTTGPLRTPRRVPMTFDLSTGVWIRSEGERVLLGRANPEDTGWREGMDWDWLEHTLTPALERFPWLEEADLDRHASWWGYYELTPDEMPILGRMPGVEGWVNACGFSGHGVMQAAAVGRVITQEVLGEAPFIDIDPLRFERFSGKQVERDIQV